MELKDFFEANPACAIAFSGGVDSSFLLAQALEYARRVGVYYVKSAFQPTFEFDDAQAVCRASGVPMTVLEVDVLADERVAGNPLDRCYWCKRAIFGSIIEAAQADGFSVVCDGTNASDDADDRPGMRALAELGVCSPLRECGLTKDRIRQLSREIGLPTWSKPAYACLATRAAAGERLTAEGLERTEVSEDFLRGLGFTDFRVRCTGDCAKLQVRADQVALVCEKREEIIDELGKRYSSVTLDLEVRP